MLKTIPEVVAHARESLTVVNAEEAVQQAQQHNGVIIDVREPSEFSDKSAKGAINIPRGLLEMKMLQLYPDDQQVIFLHCATGARAVFSAEQLKRVGYKNVSVITSCIDDICNACL
ncbi:rhodanese-like domain-containing protein [Colwellia sp. E2M01]|uniref:rhodanese-like domain-containing protein n=1 Tax=Colwellia sp. E2M01 TaxID=2841561 RepID=UPI001C097EFA|nr:rhodanese-like domain-containing protein [Colwellia sp. E2M01]MBU2869404.1 rhodanese-like domain-containing protein [Colwellia sp. E2M01]